MSQAKLLKKDILKILAKDVSGGSNTRPAFESAKSPNTFFGGADNQPFYPSAQEPSPAANPATPIVPQIVTLEPGQKAKKRPTYKSAKEPLTFFGGAKECKKAKAAAKIVCADEKKQKKKRAPSPYNVFVKDFFSRNKNLGKDRMKIVAAAWQASKSGVAPAKKAARPKIKLTTFQPPAPPPGPPPKKNEPKKRRNTPPPPPPGPPPAKKAAPAPKKPKLKIKKARFPIAEKIIDRYVTLSDDQPTLVAKKILESSGESGNDSSLLNDIVSLHAAVIAEGLDDMADSMLKLNKNTLVPMPGAGVPVSYDEWLEEENDVLLEVVTYLSTYGYTDKNRAKMSLSQYKTKLQSVVKRIGALERQRGGRAPNQGKPLPKKQLQSTDKKKPSGPRTKKNSAWMAHLAEFRKANPSVKPKDVMKMAKQTYKKVGGAHCGGAQNHCNAPPPIDGDQIGVGGAAIKPDIKMTEDTHTMPDGSIMSGKTHAGDMVLPGQVKQLMVEKMAGNMEAAPDKLPEKSAKDQTQIMVDIMNSYDEFNKRFESISNSSNSLENKRSQYNNERERIDKFHSMTLQNYGESISDDNKKIEEKAYKYALETYKIGMDSLKEGAPQQRVEFENFDDNDTITEIIDKALSVPRTALDRARSFFSVPIKNQPIQTFHPVIPALGKMATIYPYGYQLAEKAMRGGKAKKTPKQMIAQLTRDMFIRDMSRKFPEVSRKKILAAYDKHKADIRSLVTDAIVDAIEIRGGVECGPNQYASGERCFTKQERPKDFDRDKFFADQKSAAAAKERGDDGMVKSAEARTLPSIDSSTKPSSDAAMPLPAPKPQQKNEKDFVEKFSASITPPDSGPIFNTDGSDISDPRAWVDTLANIFVGTASGVETIFSALGDLF